MSSRFAVGLIVVLVWSYPGKCQHITLGAAVGTALTEDFETAYQFSNDGASVPSLTSGSRTLIAGPTFDWAFASSPFSFESDAIFRELHYEDLHVSNHNPTVTWEFPVLGKYQLLSARTGASSLRPFVEAGPSFRTTGNLNANPSHFGLTAGVGLNYRIRQLGIQPMIRYTRWSDNSQGDAIQPRADQVEFLMAFTHESSVDAQPLGRRMMVGAVLGTNLLGDYATTSSTETNVLTGTQTTFVGQSGSHSLMIGPAVILQLFENLSVESDAVYRQLREHDTDMGVVASKTYIQSTSYTYATWEFPVLVKYNLKTLTMASLIPFVEGGPAFRIPGLVTTFGASVGGGLSLHWAALHIEPTLRYTRWQADPQGAVKSNEIAAIVGLSF